MPTDPGPKETSESTGSIKDLILEQEESATLIKNRSLLEPNEIVDEERIVGRDSQLTDITQHLRVAIRNERPPNLLLYGPSGTGKSLIINAVCSNIVELCESRDIRFGVIQMNCQNIGTLGSAVYELARKVANDAEATVEVPEHGIPNKKKWRELYRLINEHYDTVVFILDELDMLVGRRDKDEPAFSRLLYQLSRANSTNEISAQVSVTAITNDTKMMENVGSRALSSFTPEDVHFSDYDANQLRAILRAREDAFHEGALSDDVIPLAAAFAAQTNGDARKAIDLVRTAGSIAEKASADQVREEHIRKAQDKVEKNRVLEVTRGISTQKKLCLFATAAVARETGTGAAKSPHGYRVYQYLTGTLSSDQYHQETYVNKMKELTTYSLVETERKSQGPHSGSYLEFTFGENPNTIIETLREDSRLDDVHDEELRAVVNTQL
ncbi:orc1/cdc6 family replication initiation protein [Natronococcus jeotgali]|uniref:ORC1-type DNA replication protein n=1 Tax=Natronococcus jeotgali DSM 18795 TaxID=1227498 RepID=L9XMA1_9EURY|nr:orc1/cdc6 family replication initiation protein [Natronococcus jeotgali]ELY62496.1 cell division control protein cdc6-like protein [Natronococcus jeotgali DSM 18795]